MRRVKSKNFMKVTYKAYAFISEKFVFSDNATERDIRRELNNFVGSQYKGKEYNTRYRIDIAVDYIYNRFLNEKPIFGNDEFYPYWDYLDVIKKMYPRHFGLTPDQVKRAYKDERKREKETGAKSPYLIFSFQESIKGKKGTLVIIGISSGSSEDSLSEFEDF